MLPLPRRLIKFVRDSSPLSVRGIHAAWQRGRITLSGDGSGAAPTLDTLVFSEDTVCLDGVRLQPRTRHYTALLSKPRGVLSTTRDPRGKGDLQPWLRSMPPGTFPAGRLDRDTTGLLLFSTDGDLSNAVLRPEMHTDKLYWLWLNETFSADDSRLEALTRRDDPRYDGGCRATLLYATEHYAEILLTLDQGKNRQIRRMCHALGLRLLQLHRKRIGPLSDAGLQVGDVRELEAHEVELLWDATGGRERLRRRKLAALRKLAARQRDAGSIDTRLETWLHESDGT